jgi:hypothetical protein
MHKNELTNYQIGFTLHGYENEILSWLWDTVSFYGKSEYPLKSVSYDINRDKEQRKSLKKFQEVIEADADYPVDKLFSFTVFSGESQRFPDTWHYGCVFDEPRKELTMFFDSSYGEENVLKFIREFLKEVLYKRSVWGGYLFYQELNYDYPVGDAYLTQGLYKEDGAAWGNLTRPGDISEMSIENERKKMQEVLNQKNKYRHIYTQTILSKYHLEEKFGEMSLAQWVEKNSYGIIEKIGIDNWLWSVPADKLYKIQTVFYNKKLLLGVM